MHDPGGRAQPAAGVAHHDIEVPHLLHHRVHRFPGGVGAGQVDLDTTRTSTECLNLFHRGVGGQQGLFHFELLVGVQVEIEDGNVSAELREPECIRSAQTPAAARDECDFSLEHHRWLASASQQRSVASTRRLLCAAVQRSLCIAGFIVVLLE
jgi:hypothetical protein